ncbi:MAG: acyl-CoA dehydrogenase family protein, partial [Bifidobacteriaceae bacterium]|nr:acyl-CoA dehydrogenase family protein [Bifidobacteriaceae bacterium]
LLQGKSGFALGITEPGAGSDNSAMITTAVHQGGKVVFNGVKTLITGAATCDYILLMAKNPDATDPRRAISMYLVPLKTEGISISLLEKITWHSTNTCEVYFDNVEADESCLVGTKGNGFSQLMRNFEMERILMAAQSLGLAECAFELAASHAATRVQFGKPIGQFQIIQQYLTDMAIKIENMRNLVYTAAAKLDAGEPLKTYGAMTKRYCAIAGCEVVDTALQIHGGMGLVVGAPISRIWRDIRVQRIGGGTDEVMVHIIGRQIVRDHTPR